MKKHFYDGLYTAAAMFTAHRPKLFWHYRLPSQKWHYRGPLFYDLTLFQILGQKFICQMFCWYLVQTKTPKGHGRWQQNFCRIHIGIPPKYSTQTFDCPCGSWLGTETEEICVPHYTTLVIVVRHLPNLERICGFPLNNLFSQAQNSISTYSCMHCTTVPFVRGHS